MRLSEKKKSEVYAAISETIMEQRIELAKYGSPSSEELDAKLFRMENKIWKQVHKALNIDTPA